MIRFEVVSVGSGGGVSCARCHGAPEPAVFDPAAEIQRRVERVIASWKGGPGPNVELGGPEPFGHPELPAIVSAATRDGVRRLRLDTDGVALQSSNNAAGALSAGVRHVSFTLLGGTMGVHDVLVGEPGALEATLAGVRVFREIAEQEGIAIAIHAVVPGCRHNLHDLPQAVASAVDAGATSVTIRLADTGADVLEALPYFTAACDTGLLNGAWAEVSGVPFCLLPGYELHLSDVIRSRQGEMSPVCASCALEAVCCGGPAGADPAILAAFAPPPGADRLARSIARVRERGGDRA